jgi:uncharacterized protein YukE
MTRAQVEINFEEANRQVREIEEAVAILQKADQIHAEMQENTAAAWKGQNSDNFQSLSRDLGSRLEKMRKLIEELAEWIRHRAKVLYDAEMEAIRIAEERAYQERLAREAEERRQMEQQRSEAEARRQADIADAERRRREMEEERARHEAEQRAAAEEAARRAAEALRRLFP